MGPKVSKLCKSQHQHDLLFVSKANDLSAYLSKNHRGRYQLWNSLVRDIKPVILDVAQPKAQALVDEHNLDPKFVEYICRSLLYAYIEDFYHDKGFYSFRQNLEIFHLGHVACGRDGQAIVYF